MNQHFFHGRLAAAILAAGVGLIFSGCAVFKSHEHNNDCVPFCSEEQENLQRDTKVEWEWFRNYRPIPYKPVGDPYLDSWGVAVDKLANQIVNEFTIAYVEGAEYAEDYNCFLAEVEAYRKKNNVSPEQARQVIWAAWVEYDRARPAEQQRCPRLFVAFNALEAQKPAEQLAKLSILLPEIGRLIDMRHNKEIQRIVDESKKDVLKGTSNILTVTAIAMRANHISRAVNFMMIHYRSVGEANQDFAKFEKEYKTNRNTAVPEEAK